MVGATAATDLLLALLPYQADRVAERATYP